MWRHREKTAVYKPKSEDSEETNPGDTLISDFQPPDSLGREDDQPCGFSRHVGPQLLTWVRDGGRGERPFRVSTARTLEGLAPRPPARVAGGLRTQQTDATQPAASVLTTLLSPLNGTWLPIGSARPGPQGPPPQPWAAANQTQALDQGAPTFLVPSSALGSCKAFLGLQKTGQQGTGRLQCGRHCVSAAGPTGSGPGIVPGCALHSTENKIEKVPVFRCSPGWGSFYIPGLDPFLLILCNSCVPACKYWVPVVLWCWRGSPASCQRVKTFTVLVNGCQCSPKA
ncbi:DAN domain family member 5 [Camelus dromedarius]|uniref:DAN domain family member 5 n=1 Tax=Camelus dromedarius TaxID=9838 RepID=UPI0031193ED7